MTLDELKEKYVGKSFNLLTIQDVIRVTSTSRSIVKFRCKCQCGNIVDIRMHAVLNNHTKSCGCLNKSKELAKLRSDNKKKYYADPNNRDAILEQSKNHAQWFKDNPDKVEERTKKFKIWCDNNKNLVRENALNASKANTQKAKELRMSVNYDFIKDYIYPDDLSKLKNGELNSNSFILTKCPKCGSYYPHMCGNVFKFKSTNFKFNTLPMCAKCYNEITSSNAEKELVSWIKSVYSGNVIENSRDIISPLELDIYIPEKKLAIEFNGTYWHNDELKEKDYHFKKSKMCYDKNIRLIHVFDFEWYNKQDKIKSLILSALGVYTNTYYARNCTVHNISYKEYDAFLNTYHLNGSVKSPIRLGLFYNNELISVIGFGKSRFNHNETELHRYCVKSGYRIVGGFSKLIKHSNIKNFISFIDFSKYTGNGYYAAGFTFSSFTEPNYFYVKQAQVLTRLQCQKHKLKDLLNEAYDKNKSEYLNMKCAGYYRVYDSGNIKVVFNN